MLENFYKESVDGKFLEKENFYHLVNAEREPNILAVTRETTNFVRQEMELKKDDEQISL